jgi:hypothetical protein
MAFTIKQNDRRPAFVVNLRDNFGEGDEAAVDLTDADTVAFSMRAKGGGAVKIGRADAVISDAATGEVTYEWDTLDTDTPGNFEAEVEVTWNDGKAETFPNKGYWDIVITDDIA